MKKMNILYVVDYYQPQLGYSEYYIPKELSRLGHTVWILTSNYFYPFPDYDNTSGKLLGPRKQKAEITNQDDIIVIKEEMKAEIFTRSIFAHHEKYLQLLQPDLVMVNKSSGFNVIRMAQLKKKYGYKLISYDAHLPSGFYASGNLFLKKVFYFLFRLFFARLLNTQVDKFAAVQEKTREIMEQFYGQKNIVHIPLGTDTQIFKYSEKEKKACKKKYKIPSHNFVIGYSGKLIETKGIDILFASFNELSQKYKDISLLLIGNGTEEYLQKCYEKVEEKYHKNIIVVGFQNNKNLYKYYSAFDVGVWPLEESTSMNDVAACGIPFIANNQIGARVRLSNNNALTYKKGNVKDLSKKIEYLYRNREKSKLMGKNGFELIINKLSWKKIVEKYLTYA